MENKQHCLINSQNCRMFEAGRDLRRSVIHAPSSSSKLQQAAEVHVPSGFERHQAEDSTNFLGNLLKCSVILTEKKFLVCLSVISYTLAHYHCLSACQEMTKRVWIHLRYFLPVHNFSGKVDVGKRYQTIMLGTSTATVVVYPYPSKVSAEPPLCGYGVTAKNNFQ